jgi:hypothetical protein
LNFSGAIFLFDLAGNRGRSIYKALLIEPMQVLLSMSALAERIIPRVGRQQRLIGCWATTAFCLCLLFRADQRSPRDGGGLAVGCLVVPRAPPLPSRRRLPAAAALPFPVNRPAAFSLHSFMADPPLALQGPKGPPVPAELFAVFPTYLLLCFGCRLAARK